MTKACGLHLVVTAGVFWTGHPGDKRLAGTVTLAIITGILQPHQLLVLPAGKFTFIVGIFQFCWHSHGLNVSHLQHLNNIGIIILGLPFLNIFWFLSIGNTMNYTFLGWYGVLIVKPCYC